MIWPGIGAVRAAVAERIGGKARGIQFRQAELLRRAAAHDVQVVAVADEAAAQRLTVDECAHLAIGTIAMPLDRERPTVDVNVPDGQPPAQRSITIASLRRRNRSDCCVRQIHAERIAALPRRIGALRVDQNQRRGNRHARIVAGNQRVAARLDQPGVVARRCESRRRDKHVAQKRDVVFDAGDFAIRRARDSTARSLLRAWRHARSPSRSSGRSASSLRRR